jgi:serine/threonine-protein phosphatase 6 regulatory ankyrin repeat subunit A
MEHLIPKLSNVNITDRLGRTCLHLAAYFGHYEMVELLIVTGSVSVNQVRSDSKVISSFFAKILLSHQWNCFNMLCSYPCHHQVINLCDVSCYFNPQNISQCDKRDRRPLHSAAFRGHEAVVRLLLQHGAEVEVRDKVK